MNMKQNVFWLPASNLPPSLPPAFQWEWPLGFVSGYSGATASDFHGLPFLLHDFWLPKNCPHHIKEPRQDKKTFKFRGLAELNHPLMTLITG